MKNARDRIRVKDLLVQATYGLLSELSHTNLKDLFHSGNSNDPVPGRYLNQLNRIEQFVTQKCLLWRGFFVLFHDSHMHKYLFKFIF